MRAARWGEAEEAVSRLGEAVRGGARDAETVPVLGPARVDPRDLGGAEGADRQSPPPHPSRLENLLGLPSAAAVRNGPAAALAAYDAIVARKPSYAAAHLGRAWSLAKLGRRAEAERALDRASELGAPAANVDRQRKAIRAGTL